MTSDPAPTATRVAIVGGSGSLGFGLALRFAQGRVQVAIGSRDPQRAGAVARSVNAFGLPGECSGHTNAGAVPLADVVVLTVPFAAQARTLRELHDLWRPGQIVVDTCVPLAAVIGGKATQLLGVWQGSAAEQARQRVPPLVGVVSAFHTVSAARLANLADPLDEDVLVCGDDPVANATLCRIISRLAGLRAVDCGPLELSRFTQGITPLLIAINARRQTLCGIRVTTQPGPQPTPEETHGSHTAGPQRRLEPKDWPDIGWSGQRHV